MADVPIVGQAFLPQTGRLSAKEKALLEEERRTKAPWEIGQEHELEKVDLLGEIRRQQDISAANNEMMKELYRQGEENRRASEANLTRERVGEMQVGATLSTTQMKEVDDLLLAVNDANAETKKLLLQRLRALGVEVPEEPPKMSWWRWVLSFLKGNSPDAYDVIADTVSNAPTAAPTQKGKRKPLSAFGG
jgi:hypothetical protein